MKFEIVLLTTAIFATAALHIHAEYKEEKRLIYFLKPLAMLLIFVMGLNVLPEEFGWYHIAMLIGLLFSIGGDVALMWPSDKFLLGLVSFLTGHVFYISGFISGIVFDISWYVWFPLLFLGSGMFFGLRTGMGKMQVPVLVYILVILVMSGMAWERHLQFDIPQTLFAACGASLFLLSDALLAWNRFRVEFKSAQLLVLGTYYAAQWALVLSLSQPTLFQLR